MPRSSLGCILLLALRGIAAQGIAAEEGHTSSVGPHFVYGVVAAYDQARDDLLIPLRWMGPAAGLRLGFDFTGAQQGHSVSLLPIVSFLENRFGHSGHAAGIELAYTFGRTVTRSPHLGTLLLGARAKWDLFDGFYESWDDEHIYWLNTYSLGPRIAWRQADPGTGWSAELDIPVVAFVARPPANRLSKTENLTSFWFHLTEPQKRLVLTGFPKYLAVHTGLSYATRLGGAHIVLSYDLELSSYDSPARITTLSHRLGFMHMVGL